MEINMINENILKLLEGKVSVLPSRYNAVSFEDYMHEKYGNDITSLTGDDMDEEVLKFVGYVIGINNSTSDLLIPLPREVEDESMNEFPSIYKIEKFDTNFNYYNERTKMTLKEIIIAMYNTLKVEGIPHYLFSKFDMRPLLK